MVNLILYQEQEDLLINEEEVRFLVEEVFSLKNLPPCDFILHFISEEAITLLHKEFFNDPTPTDCITFPIDTVKPPHGPFILGEVFISPKSALLYDNVHPYEEVSLYIIHTILHLCGYDDTTFEEETKMRLEEKRLLDHLKKKNLMLSKPK